MAPGMSLFSVNAIIILSTDDGARIFAKYYNAPHHTALAHGHSEPRHSLNGLPIIVSIYADILPASPQSTNPYPDVKAQKTFEKGLLEKTSKQTSDIILYDNRIVLYKMESDIMMYVVGSLDENEIMLYNVILALRDSLHLLFK
jgi:coatomer subunit zeta